MYINIGTELLIKDKDILEFLKTTTKTYFEIGSKYKYSNTAYILLGLIVEKVSGRTIDDYIEKVVLTNDFQL